MKTGQQLAAMKLRRLNRLHVTLKLPGLPHAARLLTLLRQQGVTPMPVMQTTETEMIDCPDCDGSGFVRDDFPSRVNRAGEEQTVTCTRCEGRGECEALCEAGECDEPRKPDSSLCAHCSAVRDDARATYRQPYSRAEIEDAYSDPTEHNKRDFLLSAGGFGD